MVIAGDIQDSPNRYFRARQEIETQKLPVVAKVIIETGSAIKLPIQHTCDLMRTFFLLNLSLISPPTKAEIKPRTLRLRALRDANYALYIG